MINFYHVGLLEVYISLCLLLLTFFRGFPLHELHPHDREDEDDGGNNQSFL